MVANLNHLSLVEDYDLVGIFHRTQAMSYYHNRLALIELIQVLYDITLYKSSYPCLGLRYRTSCPFSPYIILRNGSGSNEGCKGAESRSVPLLKPLPKPFEIPIFLQPH